MQKCAAPTSNFEEERGADIKSSRNHQDVYSKNKSGIPTYLNSDEEALVVALAEIEGVNGLPIDVNTLGANLKFFIKAVNARKSTKDITANSLSKYTRPVIKQVKCIEYGHYSQTKKSRTGSVKVSSITNNIERQSDPRLAWMMFHKIVQMYRDIREQ